MLLYVTATLLPGCAEGKTCQIWMDRGKRLMVDNSGLHNISDTPGPVGGKYLSMWLIRD